MRLGLGVKMGRSGAAAADPPPDGPVDQLAGAGAFESGAGWTLDDFGGGPPVIDGGVLTAPDGGGSSAGYVLAVPIPEGAPWAAVITVDSTSAAIDVAGALRQPASGPAIYTIYGVGGGGGVVNFYLNFTAAAVVSDVKLYDLSSVTPGANVFPYGDFASSSGFTLAGTNATISGGVFSAPANVGLRTALHVLDVTLVLGDLFFMTWTVLNRVAGFGAVRIGGNTGQGQAANGTYTAYLVTGASTQTAGGAISSNGNCAIDNIIIQPVIFTP